MIPVRCFASELVAWDSKEVFGVLLVSQVPIRMFGNSFGMWVLTAVPAFLGKIHKLPQAAATGNVLAVEVPRSPRASRAHAGTSREAEAAEQTPRTKHAQHTFP